MGQRLTGSETPQPAFLLRPRNFNPHPYESRSHVQHSQDYSSYYGHLQPQLQYYQYPQQYKQIVLPSSPERHPYNLIKGQRDYYSGQTTGRVGIK